jgi:hypothetical protein
MNSINSALKTSLLILKLVIPFYLLADVLIYLGLLQKISFIFEPITSIIGLNQNVSLSIAAGILFNIYAAIAFAAPLNLSAYEWTILGLFLGIAHALPVENAIMKKLGISYIYSTVLRISSGILAVLIFRLLPFTMDNKTIHKEISITQYNSFFEMLLNSFINATILSLKIIALISVIIFVMDFIKKKIFKNKKLNASFSIITGLILGITYGAGILLAEKKSLSKKEIFYIGTFLMVCHSIIEDTALFVIFGANLWILISIRLILAIIISFLALKLLSKKL